MFHVSEYLSRIERAYLDILEGLEPVSKAITLWLGLDGLRLNEDGTMEWVSRKRKPVETVLYQPCQSIRPIQTGLQQAIWAGQTQSTRAQIDALRAQNVAKQTQLWQSVQVANMAQQCCPPAGSGGAAGAGGDGRTSARGPHH